MIGGDLRIARLAELLMQDEWNVWTYGFDKLEDKKILLSENLEEAVLRADVVISSVPLSQDGVYVTAPFSTEKIELKRLENNLEGKCFFSGKIPENFKENPKFESFDLLEVESYAILNAIATEIDSFVLKNFITVGIIASILFSLYLSGFIKSAKQSAQNSKDMRTIMYVSEKMLQGMRC